MTTTAALPYRGWFDAPRYPRPTPLTFRHHGATGCTLFSGHVAVLGVQHLDHATFSIDAADGDEFEQFHVRDLVCVECATEVGPVAAYEHARTDGTLTTPQASQWYQDHAVGWCRVSTDLFGITAAGFLNAGVRVRGGLAASGHWCDDGHGWQLVGLTLCGAPGLPVPDWTTGGVHLAFPGVAAH